MIAQKASISGIAASVTGDAVSSAMSNVPAAAARTRKPTSMKAEPASV